MFSFYAAFSVEAVQRVRAFVLNVYRDDLVVLFSLPRHGGDTLSLTDPSDNRRWRDEGRSKNVHANQLLVIGGYKDSTL